MDPNTVTVRVQVIDLKPFTLDLQLPTYLPARDLTQRVARDAGLEAHWGDGRRRLYWLRARGRLMADEEALADLGVVQGELVYLLPEPPAGSGVVERTPEYPETHDYSGAGVGAIVASLAMVLAWSAGWGVALAHDRGTATVTLPALALGFFCASLARHAWGGRGNQARIAATGLALHLLFTVIAYLGPVAVSDAKATDAWQAVTPGILTGIVGVLLGWLAWWGAVEPLPAREVVEAEAARPEEAAVPCGICGGMVDPGVRAACVHGCGQVFHQGCWRAKVAVYRGDANTCAICTRRVA
jgi:uncharacterized ubiquitin-like protein YukD